MVITGGGLPIISTELVSTESATIIANALIQSSSHRDWLDYLIAFGTLFAGIGGGKFIFQFVKFQDILSGLKLRSLKQKYPLSRYNKDYFLWGISGDNKWWLIDKRHNTRHHVKDMTTVRNMGWEGFRDDVDRSEIEKYSKAEEISSHL